MITTEQKKAWQENYYITLRVALGCFVLPVVVLVVVSLINPHTNLPSTTDTFLDYSIGISCIILVLLGWCWSVAAWKIKKKYLTLEK